MRNAPFPRVELDEVSQATRDYLAERAAETTATRRAFVLAMLRTGRPMYGLRTRVRPEVKAKRRAANKAARIARRAAR